MFKQTGYQFGWVVAAVLLSATAFATSTNESAGTAFGKSADKQNNVEVERIERQESLIDAQQEFALADKALNKAIIGKQLEEISTEEIAGVIRQAERAASHGSAAAYNLLYTVYFSGWGVPADNVRAIEYLRRAAVMGDVGAKLNYAILLYQGTPQVSKNTEKACGMFGELVADARVAAVVSYFMGVIEFNGECGRPADEKYGMELIRFSADHGMGEAELKVAMDYENGWTVPVDVRTALTWYEKAAEHGQPRAVWRVGMAYENAEFRKRDTAIALEYFQFAAKEGDANGIASLAMKHRTGDGIERNLSRARELFEQAAALGNAQANIELATMYLNGEGMPVDAVQARVFYTRAIAMGAAEQPGLLQAIEEKMSAEQLNKSRQAIANVAGAR